MGGTNVLQNSIDSLTTAVNNLSTQMGSANFGAGSAGGQATKQQNSSLSTQPFPKMQNQFQPPGGSGGGGNISPNNNFNSFANLASSAAGPTMMLGAIAKMGQNMMGNQLQLNQAATTALPFMATNGMSQSQAMQQYYSLVGATPGNQMNLGTGGIAGNVALQQTLAQLGGTQNYNQSALGRAGYGASAAFGVANPTLSTAAAAQLGAGLYSPGFSYNMMRMGMGTARGANGSALNPGQLSQQVLKGFGVGGMYGAKLFGNLSSPKGQLDMSSLLQGTGVSNSAFTGYLNDYATLMNKDHMSATSATSLISKATTGSTANMKAARSRLNKLGVTTASNDISNLEQAQAVTTGRQGEYASGFNSAISQSTGMLEQFNNALNKLLNGPLGNAAGYAGGMGGMASGISHGVGSGLGFGSALTIAKLFGLGGGGGASAAGGGASAAGGGSIAAMAAAALPAIGGMLIGAAAKAIGDKLSPSGTTKGAVNKTIQNQHVLPMGMGSSPVYSQN